MSNVIEFPIRKTQQCKDLQHIARTTKSVVFTCIKDEMLALKMPFMKDKYLQAKALEIADMYHNILVEYHQNDENFT
jgi:hypothetical protein